MHMFAYKGASQLIRNCNVFLTRKNYVCRFVRGIRMIEKLFEHSLRSSFKFKNDLANVHAVSPDDQRTP